MTCLASGREHPSHEFVLPSPLAIATLTFQTPTIMSNQGIPHIKTIQDGSRKTSS